MPHEYHPDALLEAEADIRSRLRGQAVDIEVQHAISNVYRAATVLSRTAERAVLTDAKLSWTGFTVLWVLWVWGEMDPSRLAAELGLTMGTLTGVRTGLEKRGLLVSRRNETDGRRLQISLTDEGERTIEGIYPHFNDWASGMLGSLSRAQILELANLLQHVIVAPTN